jgi:hypothetical protein
MTVNSGPRDKLLIYTICPKTPLLYFNGLLAWILDLHIIQGQYIQQKKLQGWVLFYWRNIQSFAWSL